MIYIASPYSHPNPDVRQARYEAACRTAVTLLRTGQIIFSPIVHSHPLAAFGLPDDWAFWGRIDRAMLEWCDEVVVLMLDGWDRSVGVREEIAYARALGLPIRYLPADVAHGSPTFAPVATGAGG